MPVNQMPEMEENNQTFQCSVRRLGPAIGLGILTCKTKLITDVAGDLGKGWRGHRCASSVSSAVTDTPSPDVATNRVERHFGGAGGGFMVSKPSCRRWLKVSLKKDTSLGWGDMK